MQRLASRLVKSFGLIALFLAAALLGTATGVLFAFVGDLPQISALDDYSPSTITRVVGRDGAVVGEFATERRTIVTYEQIPEVLRLPWLLLSLVVFIGSFLLAVRWFARKTEEMRNRYLGYFGERVVAEHLEPLKLQGWRVFHDVPCQHEGVKFNIDHIAVGAGGVFIIETKTRRKGSARPGFKDNVVSFDGQRLVWPWAEDNHGLEQAERNALWFAKIVKQETGEQVVVTPILVLPGWWVEMKPMRSARFCRVANPKWLPDILGRERPILSEVQVGAIAAKLEIRCRDVEY